MMCVLWLRYMLRTSSSSCSFWLRICCSCENWSWLFSSIIWWRASSCCTPYSSTPTSSRWTFLVFTASSYSSKKQQQQAIKTASSLTKASVCMKPWLTVIWLCVFKSTSSSIQWVVSLLKWLTKLSVLNVSSYATINNKTSVKLDWRCFKNRSMIGRIESVCVLSNQIRLLKYRKSMLCVAGPRCESCEALPREDV